MFFKQEVEKEATEAREVKAAKIVKPKQLKELKERQGSKLSDYPMRLKLLSAGVGLSMALMILLLISGCASQSKKPLPLYKQVEVPTVKAYQDEVNHTQNYVYRADVKS